MIKSHYEPTLLLVDDEINCHKCLKFMLTGYKIVSAYDISKAIINIDRSEFSAVIADLHFKGSNKGAFKGFELISSIRSRKNHLPIVAISGYEVKTLVEKQAIAAGANVFLLKEEFSRKKWDGILNNLINPSLQ